MSMRLLTVTAVAATVVTMGASSAVADQPTRVTGSAVAVAGAGAVVETQLSGVDLAAEGLTVQNYEALIADLKAAGYRSVKGVIKVKANGVTLNLPEAGPSAELGGGWDGWNGPYISFNRVDQGALLAGGAAALAAAICLIPAVGQAACVAAAAIVAIAFYYVTEYGRCSTTRPNLRVYVWSRNSGCYR